MSDRRIRACPRCGSLRIRAFSLREGGVPGASEMSGMYYCERCKKKAMPIIFDDEKEYKKFIKQMRKAP
ncbi:hypothetical protein H0N99_04875 [Candidatus Micrarchaeota archaeon]|nr:hypothetical protein [Candidatus Micrarchaeota archaeon]